MRTFTAAIAAGVVLVTVRPAGAQAPADTSWVSRCALYEVNIRDFSQTGDLKGVTAGLDRIQASGANVIWLMPVHPVGVKNRKGTLGSPYAARDYYAIDSTFGTPQDFQALVRAAHARGLKIILDWVPDHTAWDHVWIQEHPEYYARNENGELTVPRDLQGKLTDWTDVAQLDYRHAALREAMIAAMRHWLVDVELDGFRVDVAGSCRTHSGARRFPRSAPPCRGASCSSPSGATSTCTGWASTSPTPGTPTAGSRRCGRAPRRIPWF